MLQVLDTYCREWNFQPGYAKTQQVRFGAAQKRKGVNGTLFLPSMHHDGGPPSDRYRDGRGVGSKTSGPLAWARMAVLHFSLARAVLQLCIDRGAKSVPSILAAPAFSGHHQSALALAAVVARSTCLRVA